MGVSRPAGVRRAPITLEVAQRETAPEEGATYRLAGRTVRISPPLREAEPFRVGTRTVPCAPSARPVASGRLPEREIVYRGPAWIGDAERSVLCLREAERFLVELEGIGSLTVTADGSHAAVDGTAPGVEASVLAEAALGPALVLALALGGTLCLHASAVVTDRGDGDEGVLAFLGASGAGKSTLARLLDGLRPGFRRAADDLLPVSLGARGRTEALAHPHFPQLKLGPAEQPGPSLPEAVPLRGLFVLASGGAPPGTRSPRVRHRPMGPREALVALLRHTVAARLFDRSLLRAHLDRCSALAEAVPVSELVYPWSGSLVDGLPETIAAGMEGA